MPQQPFCSATYTCMHNRDAQTAMQQRQRQNTASCMVSALHSQSASPGQLKTLLPIIRHSLRHMQVGKGAALPSKQQPAHTIQCRASQTAHIIPPHTCDEHKEAVQGSTRVGINTWRQAIPLALSSDDQWPVRPICAEQATTSHPQCTQYHADNACSQ